MRLLLTTQDQERAFGISDFLKSNDIENQLETSTNNDWDNSDYGTLTYRLWVYDEDQYQKAAEMAQEYIPGQTIVTPRSDKPELFPDLMENLDKQETRIPPPKTVGWNRQPLGQVTFYLLMACCMLFLYSQLTGPIILTKVDPKLPFMPVYSSHIQKELLYDYPHAYDYIDDVVKIVGDDKLQNVDEFPPAAIALYDKYKETPYWTGFYDEAVSYLKDPATYQPSKAPLFEKIRKGEIWRLISSCFLHGGLFHLIFNMILLVILGKQLEQRMGKARYIIFVLLAAVFSNTVQYLMGGGNFEGMSGVICAMLTFIWMRKMLAPWEGYQLESSSLGFMMFFLFTMLAIQIGSFYTEVALGTPLGPPIANSAHMAGLAIGVLMGCLTYFEWRES